MARVAIIGAGYAGHTAGLYLGNTLGKRHNITLINQSDRFLFVPSLAWVGVGRMDVEKTRFPLKPVYDRMHVNFVHGRARFIPTISTSSSRRKMAAARRRYRMIIWSSPPSRSSTLPRRQGWGQSASSSPRLARRVSLSR